jgi:hypothetical protein
MSQFTELGKKLLRINRPGLHVLESKHISDHDLERYYLGMVTDETELGPLEEHLLCCPKCVERAEEAQDYVDAMRIAAYDHVGYMDVEMLSITSGRS